MELKLECEPFYFILSLLFSKVVDKKKKKRVKVALDHIPMV